VGVIYGIAAAMLYGSGDYLGGRASSGVDVRRVLLIAQCTAAVASLVCVLVVSGHAIGRDLAYGAAAGVGTAVGLGLLYRALAIGSAGVVAPLTAVVGAIVPVTWGVAIGERPSALAGAGVVVAVFAAALIAREPDDSDAPRAGVAMALGAGFALGSGFVCYAATSDGSGLWPLVSARAVAIALIAGALILSRGNPSPGPLTVRQRWLAVGAGAFDVGGTVSLVAGVRSDLAVLVAAITALAPGFTVGWSWLFLHDRVSRVQTVGIVLALIGLAAIAAG
jgi:drug/metabolite transporter (DMT)-like permease